MEYKSTNSGLLTADNVKEGDKLVLLEPAYSTFSAAKQTTYWNVKVYLPATKAKKLAGLMESVCDSFAEKWGNHTEEWVGHIVRVEIKISKAGKPYIILVPTDEDVVNVNNLVEPEDDLSDLPPADEKKEVKPTPGRGKVLNNGVEYPEEEINPDDIPF